MTEAASLTNAQIGEESQLPIEQLVKQVAAIGSKAVNRGRQLEARRYSSRAQFFRPVSVSVSVRATAIISSTVTTKKVASSFFLPTILFQLLVSSIGESRLINFVRQLNPRNVMQKHVTLCKKS